MGKLFIPDSLCGDRGIINVHALRIPHNTSLSKTMILWPTTRNWSSWSPFPPPKPCKNDALKAPQTGKSSSSTGLVPPAPEQVSRTISEYLICYAKMRTSAPSMKGNRTCCLTFTKRKLREYSVATPSCYHQQSGYPTWNRWSHWYLGKRTSWRCQI